MARENVQNQNTHTKENFQLIWLHKNPELMNEWMVDGRVGVQDNNNRLEIDPIENPFCWNEK